jgi:GH24 family phage-related lysozyme (muramidase)
MGPAVVSKWLEARDTNPELGLNGVMIVPLVLLLLVSVPSSAQDLPALPRQVREAMPVLSERGLRMLAALEGCHARKGRHMPYGGRVPHVGYGHQVKPGEVSQLRQGISEREALALLQTDASKAAAAVQELVSIPLAPHEFDALVMLAYNVGIEGLRGTRLVACLNENKKREAAERWMDFSKVRDRDSGELKESPSLLKRRQDELYLFRTGQYVLLPPKNAAGRRNAS